VGKNHPDLEKTPILRLEVHYNPTVRLAARLMNFNQSDDLLCDALGQGHSVSIARHR